MTKVNVTYNMPNDDSAVAITGGKRFFDGQSVELNTETHDGLIKKLRGNPHFTVEDVAFESPAPIDPQSNSGSWGK